MPKWTITKLIAIGSLAVVRLVLSLIGAALMAITGILGSSGSINLFVAGIISVFTCLLIKKFGAATILAFIFSILAIPLPLGGAPGFLPKVLVITSAGFFIDIVFLLLRRKERLAAIISAGFFIIIEAFEMIWLGRMVLIPGIEEFTKLFLSPIIIPVVFVAGAFAGYLGYLLYKKLENTSIVKRIQI